MASNEVHKQYETTIAMLESVIALYRSRCTALEKIVASQAKALKDEDVNDIISYVKGEITLEQLLER